MNLRYIFTMTFAILLLSGCSSVGPDFVKPKIEKLPALWDKNSTNTKNIQKWWELFNDETLNILVQKASKQNLTLRSAGLRILQSRTLLGISESLNYPQHQAISGTLAGVRKNGYDFVSRRVGFDVGWELDIWGKYARGIESSEATLYASMASYNDILVTVVSEVARNYINYKTAQEREMFAKRNIAIQKRVAKMTQIQFNAGNVSELDVQQALTQLYNTKSLLPSFYLTMIKSKNAIAILLGVLPQDIESILQSEKKRNIKNISDENYDYKASSYIPVIDISDEFKVDAQLLTRRPDLQMAQYNAQAQNARIGAAKAELYPHFSLFGTIGYNSQNSLGDGLSLGDAIGISAGPTFSWNILNYGRIKNQVRFQDAKFQESLTNYNSVVLQAVQEVSNALYGYRLTKEQLKLNALATDATLRAFNLSMTQYENGLVSYQRLLSTVEKLTKNEDNYAVLKGSISTQAIMLYKALGGGWQINTKSDYLNKNDIEQMNKRVDWGNYLEDEK